MSEQYFAKKPGCESRPVAFETECVGVRASFETDAGVFSKGELDKGTELLLEALPLSLEEIFIYELGGEDYAVRDIVL